MYLDFHKEIQHLRLLNTENDIACMPSKMISYFFCIYLFTAI